MSLDEETRREITEAVKFAITANLEQCSLSNEERSWVRLAIKAEVERSEFRKAVIEKTLSALLYSAIVAIAAYVWHNFQQHITFK